MRKKLSFLLVLMLLCGILSGCGTEPTEEAEFAMDILSTGKSDAIIFTMDGLVFINDAADEDDFENICRHLDRLGTDTIDYLIISHYDKDHIGSAAGLIRKYSVGEVISPDYVENSEPFSAMAQAIDETGTLWTILTSAREISTPSGFVRIEPPPMDYGDDNNNSMITTVDWKSNRFLLMGDAKKKRTEDFLPGAESGYLLIKLPHHGDSNKKLEALVEAVSPEYGVETVSGAEIVEDTLIESLKKCGTQLYLTRDGEVTVRGTGNQVTISQVH